MSVKSSISYRFYQFVTTRYTTDLILYNKLHLLTFMS